MIKYFKIIVFLTSFLWVQNVLAQDTIALNTYHAFEATYHPNYTYYWWFVSPSGDTVRFSSKENKTEGYYWENAGQYQLFARAVTSNSCESDIISKYFVVKEGGGNGNEIKIFALADFAVGEENTVIAGNVATNDFIFPDNNTSLSYSLVGTTLPGLTFNPDGTYTFQPPAGEYGEFTFTYQVCLSDTQCENATVVINVLSSTAANNTKPIASPDVFLTYSGNPLTNNLLLNDFDYQESSLSTSGTPIDAPKNGQVTILADGTFTYTPNVGFAGKDSFKYEVCNDATPKECDQEWVYVHVDDFTTEGAWPPLSIYDDVIFYEEGKEFSVAENDFSLNGKPLIYNTTLVEAAQSGNIVLSENGTFTYVPNPGFSGVDKIVYMVCSSENENICQYATTYIVVKGSNIWQNVKETLNAGNDTIIGGCSPYRLQASVAGVEGLSYAWEPAENLDNPTSLTPLFTPGNTTTFVVTVSNGSGQSTKDTVKITISDIYAEAGEDLIIEEGTTAMLDGSKSFAKAIQYDWITENGNIVSGKNTAKPIVDKPGVYYLHITDSFNCKAIDSVEVSLLTYAPIAKDDYDTTAYQTATTINVLANDSDADGDLSPGSLSIEQHPTNGTVYINYDDYSIVYKPNDGFVGSDVFQYKICDLTNRCDNASVYVLVTELEFFIPEAFTPNGDAINDYFEIKGIELYEGNSIIIMNRWGKVVYEAKNYGISTNPQYWDGKSNVAGLNGDLPSGTYYYILDLNNNKKRIAGAVYLDR